MKLKNWSLIIGALLAIALAATLTAGSLEAMFDYREIFSALGETLAILGAAAFGSWIVSR
jgi:hypothetical protein